MELTIGCTTRPYSGLTYQEGFSRIGAAGYTDVAVFASAGQVPVQADTSAEDVVAVKKAAADAGVSPSMLIGATKLKLGLEAAVDDYKRLIDNAAGLGTKWLLDCGTSREEEYDDYFDLMRQASPHAEQAGVQITMKPHGGISLTTKDLEDANEKVSHPAFGICFDPGNIIYYTKGEMHPEPDSEKVAPIVTTGIIKDCVVENGEPDVMVTAGDGLVDFPKVLQGMTAGGFSGPLYVECVGSKEPDEVDRDVAFTLGYVKGILESI